MPHFAIIVAIGLFSIVSRFATADQPKPAWEWTIEERLAARLKITRSNSPKPIRATAAEGNVNRGGGLVTSSIDGRMNPELFLPSELFDGLLTAFMRDEVLRAKQRGLYGPMIRNLGHDDQLFWSTLQPLVDSYLPYRFGSSMGNREKVARWDAERCGERHRALEAARSVFGRREFDRLLYVVIAPTAQHSDSATDGVATDRMNELRRQEEGRCE